MTRLSHTQHNRLSRYLLDLYTMRDHASLVTHILSSLHTLIDCELISYTEMDFRRTQLVYNWGPDHPSLREALRPALERTGHQHPTIPYILKTRGQQSVQISDFLTQKAYKRLDIYQDFFKQVDTNYQLAALIQVKPSFMIPVCFNRKHRDFATQDRTQLDLLRPHLVQSFQNARIISHLKTQLTETSYAIEANHQALISVTTNGQILFATPSAVQLLHRHGLSPRRSSNWLPTYLREWVTHLTAQFNSHARIAAPIQPLAIERNETCLNLQLLRHGEHYLLMLKETRTYSSSSLQGLAQLGLSARETEVLGWVTQGKTNPEIGMILNISHRTVQKHLKRIYTRLGVENRHAAMTVAMEATRRERNGDNYD